MRHPAEKEIRDLLDEIEHKQEIETQAKSLNSDLESLNSDQDFLKPKWEDYSPISVVNLWTAVCLASGVNPKHKYANLSWLQHALDHLTGDAGNRVRELQNIYTFALDAVNAGELTVSIPNRMLALKRFSTWAQQNALSLPTKFPGCNKSDDGQEATRRLLLLRELGGSSKKVQGDWRFKGIKKLEEEEKANGRKRCDQKTIRFDLKEAAKTELDEKTAGFHTGLGQR